MPRKSTYETPAEKQRAYRKRKAAEVGEEAGMRKASEIAPVSADLGVESVGRGEERENGQPVSAVASKREPAKRTWPVTPDSVLTVFDPESSLSAHTQAVLDSRQREWDKMAYLRAERKAGKVESDLL